MKNFLTDVLIKKVEAPTTAGQTAIDTAVVDTQGYQSCTFVWSMGSITAGAVTSAKVQQGDEAGGGDMDDLAGSAITIAADDDGQTFAVEVHRPTKRYVRLVISRATQDSVVGEIYAFLYGARDLPVSNNRTDEMTSKIHSSPAEGTA